MEGAGKEKPASAWRCSEAPSGDGRSGEDFAYDNSLERPVTFINSGLSGVENGQQVTENRFPCCFFRLSKTLKAGESACLYELFGQAGARGSAAGFPWAGSDLRLLRRRIPPRLGIP